MNEEIVWAKIITSLSGDLDERVLGNWFSSLKLKEINDHAMIIESPNSFTSDWVKRNYQAQLDTAARTAIGKPVMIQFIVNPARMAEEITGDKTPLREQPAKESPLKTILSGGTAFRFNPKYTFDNFMVGRSNQFAYAACQAVAEKSARNYNPLFIYGGVGLGKTHLLNAVGHRLQQKNPRCKIICIQAESFLNEMINALRSEKMDAFRKRFRKECDVLLMDDIEIIAGKERTQEEFFYTFNDLYLAGKKIIITSDKFPKDMTTLEERLQSRFESGIIVDIQPPEFETRLSILKHIAATESIFLPDEIAVYMAERIKSNIRKLEGSLIRLAAVSSLMGSAPSLSMAQDVVSTVMDEAKVRLNSDEVMKIVAAYFKIKVSDIKSPKRNRKFVVPRQLAAYLCRELCSMSYPEIGAAFGGRDHSTIIHSCRKIGVDQNTDPELSRHLETLKRQMKVHE